MWVNVYNTEEDVYNKEGEVYNKEGEVYNIEGESLSHCSVILLNKLSILEYRFTEKLWRYTQSS